MSDQKKESFRELLQRYHARTHPAQPAQIAPVPPKPVPAVLPCAEWMASAAAFLIECQRGLDCIPAAVVELCLHRGITLDSAAAHARFTTFHEIKYF